MTRLRRRMIQDMRLVRLSRTVAQTKTYTLLWSWGAMVQNAYPIVHGTLPRSDTGWRLIASLWGSRASPARPKISLSVRIVGGQSAPCTQGNLYERLLYHTHSLVANLDTL